jgi:hypothetical protein
MGVKATLIGMASGPTNSHIPPMPRTVSHRTPDLFDHVPSAPQRGRRVLPKVVAPALDLTSLPDARLARLLVEVASELQRRRGDKRPAESRPELDQHIREAARLLEVLLPQQTGRRKRSTPAEAQPTLQEAKRKAIRTALQAGVSPGQVAKHFGLSLAAVRMALADAK